MATEPVPQAENTIVGDEKIIGDEKKIPDHTFDPENGEDAVSIGKGDVLGQEHVDPVLNAKMHLVNNAIDEIGFTPYHAKLFCLNGFG